LCPIRKRLISGLAKRLKQFFYALAFKERSPRKLTLSCCLGIYIAFSPYVCFHTVMIFFFSWLFRLNCAITLSSSYLINNPWTMIPVYVLDYLFGNWFLKTTFGYDSMTINPLWMDWINTQLTYYTGLKGISFWAFMVGGNLLGIIFSAILYPVLMLFFSRMSQDSIKTGKPIE